MLSVFHPADDGGLAAEGMALPFLSQRLPMSSAGLAESHSDESRKKPTAGVKRETDMKEGCQQTGFMESRENGIMGWSQGEP